MEYHNLLAIMSAGTNSTLYIIEYQLSMRYGNAFSIIWKCLFAIPVCLIELVAFIVLLILSLVGKIVVIIPLINLLYSIVFEIIHFIAFLFGLLGNLPIANDYINTIRQSYTLDRYDAFVNYYFSMKKRLLLLLICPLFVLRFLHANTSYVHSNQNMHHEECCCSENFEASHSEKNIRYVYQNHCWRCNASIDSRKNKRCSQCGWYICNNCGACESDCPRMISSSDSESKKDYSWVWFVVIGGVVVGGIIIFKRNQS